MWGARTREGSRSSESMLMQAPCSSVVLPSLPGGVARQRPAAFTYALPLHRRCSATSRDRFERRGGARWSNPSSTLPRSPRLPQVAGPPAGLGLGRRASTAAGRARHPRWVDGRRRACVKLPSADNASRPLPHLRPFG